MNKLVGTDVYVSDLYGNRMLALDDIITANYNVVLNGVGTCQVVLPGWFDFNLLRQGLWLDFWRSPGMGLPLEPKYRYSLESYRLQETKDGVRYVTLGGLHTNGVLAWRIGTRDVFASATKYNLASDDWMKKLVRENYLSGADDAVTRLITTWGGRSLEATLNMSVEPDHSFAPLYEKEFTTSSVLDQIQGPPKVLAADEIDPYWLFWELVWSGDNELDFRTYHGTRNRDRRASSRSPIILDVESNTLTEADYETDYSKSVSLVFAAGKLEGDDRLVEFADEYRLLSSPSSRREKHIGTTTDARGDSPGDTATAAEMLTQMEPFALRALREGRHVERVNAKFTESLALKWGEDIDFGDMATLRFWGKMQDVRVSSASYTISSDGEVVQAKLDPMTWTSAVNA